MTKKQFDAAAVAAELRNQTAEIRKPRFRKSTLDKYEDEIKALKKEGNTTAEIHRFIRSKRIKISYHAVLKWLKKNG